MAAYYNEIDPYATEWLRKLISSGCIAPGDVDERSIAEVHSDDLRGYTQCHFFAGVGGWSLAARLAGFPDDRPLWTGSCPCQPFSVAGKGGAQADERHLWPVFFDLIRACRPDVVMGEQVAAAVGKDWLDGVSADLEGIGYACGAAVVPACAVDAPHRRDRLWFVADCGGRAAGDHAAHHHARRPGRFSLADASGARLAQRERNAGIPEEALVTPARQDAADDGQRSGAVSYAARELPYGAGDFGPHGRRERANRRAWDGYEWAIGADGKARRVEPGIRLLAHGVPARVGKLRAYGNAIVPQVAAEVIGAYLDARAANDNLPQRVAA